MTESRPPLTPGEPAPDFTLSAANRDGIVSLSAYRGKSPVLVTLFRGLFCPFCRRAITQLGLSHARLHALGVEALAIVATTVDNARAYFEYRPARVLVAADPELTTHRAYGLPFVEMTPEIAQQLQTVKINPTGELSEPLPLLDAAAALDDAEGFKATETDRADHERQLGQLKGQFLVDRGGVVRWVNIEGAREGIAGLGKFPDGNELLAAAQLVA